MNLPAWLRFAELSLLAGWLVWRAYRPARRRSDAWLPLTVFGLAAAQLILEAQAATDPFTPLTVMLPVVLTTVYGALSATICVLAIGAAVWILRGPAMLSWLPALVLIA